MAPLYGEVPADFDVVGGFFMRFMGILHTFACWSQSNKLACSSPKYRESDDRHDR